MTSMLRIPLHAEPKAHQRLLDLQRGFASVCNALAPLVQQTRVWNRVALHHLAYRQLREQFPEMGSQMVCNAIYSVSRTGRLVFQHPQSPFSLARLGDKPLPLLRFTEDCPVYFDRHTLSLKDGQLSMFTLDGRMRFQLALSAQDEALFHTGKLSEVVLSRQADGLFSLTFQLVNAEVPGSKSMAGAEGVAMSLGTAAAEAAERSGGAIPHYVMVEPMPSISKTETIR